MKSRKQTRQAHLTASLIVLGLFIGGLAHAVYEPSPLSDPSRRWSVDLGISGGYDDNIHSRPDNDPNKQSSGTMILNPRLAINIPLDQTFIGLRYSYDWIYYFDRAHAGDEYEEEYDQNHTVDLIFSHRFTPRFQLDITDNFRRGLSPALTEIGGIPNPRPETGDYFFNNLSTTFTYNLTRVWTLNIFNSWEYWSYDDSTQQDRNIYSPGIGVNYLLSPVTTLGLNLRVGLVDYDDPGPNDQKNSVSETVYLFLSHLFNPQLSIQLSAGGSYTEMGDDHTSGSPYASGSLTYRYSQNGTVSIGASYFLYTSDQYGYRTSDTVATFLQCTHAITPKLTARLNLTFLHSEFNDPDFTIPSGTPEPSEDAWRVTVGASYSFTRWFFAEANYEFAHSSGVGAGSYDRNRFWAGVRFTY